MYRRNAYKSSTISPEDFETHLLWASCYVSKPEGADIRGWYYTLHKVLFGAWVSRAIYSC